MEFDKLNVSLNNESRVKINDVLIHNEIIPQDILLNNDDLEATNQITELERKVKVKPYLETTYKYKGDKYDQKSIIFENDYSFIEQFKLLSTKKILPDEFKFDMQIRISNFNIRENLFTYVTYGIEGSIEGQEILLERRYKEFTEFRKSLCDNYPAFFIPPIPPKKSFGNVEEGFIKLRQNFLQLFFNRIAAAPHLASSYHTKLFLEKNNDCYKNIKGLHESKIFSIYENYKNYFSILEDLEINQLHKNYVTTKFYKNLCKTKTFLKDFILISSESINIKTEFEREIQYFYEDFYDMENNYIFDMFKLDKDQREKLNHHIIECGLTENMYKSKYDSTPQVIFEWVSLELIDTEAMIESISCIYKYSDLLEGKLKLLKEKNSKLSSYTNNSWSNAINNFLFSTDLKYIQELTINVEILKDEVEIIKKMIELFYKILYYIEIQ
jgi:hypothetical protein